jgi:hypothetical protein
LAARKNPSWEIGGARGIPRQSIDFPLVDVLDGKVKTSGVALLGKQTAAETAWHIYTYNLSIIHLNNLLKGPR